MTAPWKLAGALAVAIMVSGVTLPAAKDDAPATVPANPTFAKDVLPIFQRSCQQCHRPDQMAPFSLLSYEDARPWARSIKQKVETRYMPPWHLDRSVGEYDPDPSLSDTEIAIISKWVDNGAPKGDMKDAPPPVVFPPANSWVFGEEPDLVVTSSGYDVPRSGPDLYPSVTVPSGLTEDRYIKWMQIMPENPKVVHHVLVYTIQDAQSVGQVVRTSGNARAGRNGNNQAAASGQPTTSLLIEYARGNDGDIFREGSAKMLQAGSQIRFSFHYHPNGETAVPSEKTKIGIKFFPKGYEPKHLIVTNGISSQETLVIPPGEANARSDSYFRLDQPARLVSFQPHMHYRGKRQTLEAILPNGQVQLLTDVNRFTWLWQIAYPYKNEPALPAGTVLHVTAYHDNSAGNKENPDPSAFVGWGARTVDEMNIGWLDFYYITDQEYTEYQQQQASRTRTANTQQQQ
jgi:mono/diheme cytochrome c family protein